LIEAMKSFSLKEGSIVTAEYKDMIKTEAGKINIIPLWEWLLVKQ
jgi:predicted AAA+ superfamily ATPase